MVFYSEIKDLLELLLARLLRLSLSIVVQHACYIIGVLQCEVIFKDGNSFFVHFLVFMELKALDLVH